MAERPILFSAPMVRAILAGTKTQTRRVVKYAEPDLVDADGWPLRDLSECGAGEVRAGCPYGAPGDRLWLRECYSGPHELTGIPPREWPATTPIWYWADGSPTHVDLTRPKPGMHMPRWASRITLEITGVRVERLQDISEADARAEGVEPDAFERTCDNYGGVLYRRLWESINGPGSWDANPSVWIVEFRRIS